MMMYDPSSLDEEKWNLWTKAMTDCNVKTQDYYDRAGGKQLSTSEVYEVMKDPKYRDIHHNVLQYLEEGTIDLVCLSTDMVMTHCDTTRAVSGYVDVRCNCWFDAYQAIYGTCPVVDMEFGHCEHTVAPVVCTAESEVEAGEKEGEEETDNGMPDLPEMPSRGGRGRRRR